MGVTGTERQEHFIALANAHAEDFKKRVAQHDRQNSFPFENVEAMKASGYTNMTVPAELGGGGVSVLDLSLAQERLARGDGPTAVAVNMHLLAVGIFADVWRSGEETVRPFLESIARDHLILAGGTNDPRMSRPMSHYPHNQFLAAEMEIGLRAARAMVMQTASALSDLDRRAAPPLLDLIACHQFVMETAFSVVDKAMRLVGGAALFRSSPLEQMYRDARAAILHQPFAGYDGRGWLGKLVFGLPPDTMPRWV